MIQRALIVCGLMALLAGCAGRPIQTPARVEPVVADDDERAVTASALLFDAPLYSEDLPPDLSREGREPSAFVAYEDQTTTFSYVHIDDRQLIRSRDNRDRYERRAIIERFGSSSR